MAKEPNSVTEWNDYLGVTWCDVAHNFTDATGSPLTVAAVSGSPTFGLSRITSDATILAPPQDQFADQGAIRVNTASELLYRGADANWSVHATIPTIYILRFRVLSVSGTLEVIYSGLSGVGNEGWSLNYKGSGANSGLSFTMMGTTSSVVGGSAALFNDGLWHTAMVVIDDANARGILVCEIGNITLTGVAYSETSALLCTIGPPSTGSSFTAAVEYAVSAKGKHSTGYTAVASLFGKAEDMRRSLSLGLSGAGDDTAGADDQAPSTIGGESVEGSFNGTDPEFEFDTYWTGVGASGAAVGAGVYDSEVDPTFFTGVAAAGATIGRGTYTGLRFAREQHVQAAIARVVSQLYDGFDPLAAEFLGGATSSNTTGSGAYDGS